ncbi:MAG: glycine cleavage system aminomethyltransferase GcvT [Flavobacteriaceae bacterium]|nr:glycine cleavage system aminomethyltransferase GcvT [Flavobacteriaceae bacterium]MCY4268473.1 glycine cleavage system aminomethyltransferase GcvT [Flavobacteriaceae bacterium]
MQKTKLYETHLKLEAKMVPFAGYFMPIQYQSATVEHLTVRQHLGVFDVSHMGEFIVEGKQAKDFLQWVCSNDITKLYVGRAQYNFFPNGKGGVVDDLIVYQLDHLKYLLVVNAANIEKDWQWLQQQAHTYDVQLTDISSQTSLLAIQGPQAIQAMQSLTSVDLTALKFYHHQKGRFAGIEDVLIATTGYTGSGGIEIYFNNESAPHIWNRVLEAGQVFGIQPIGLAARDTLRLEMGFCLYGHELKDELSPISSGLGWVTKPETKCIDHEFLANQKSHPPNKKLVGLELQDRGIPRKDQEIFDLKEHPIGYVTSGTFSPTLKKGIALAIINSSIQLGDPVFIQVRHKLLKAVVVKPPFINR